MNYYESIEKLLTEYNEKIYEINPFQIYSRLCDYIGGNIYDKALAYSFYKTCEKLNYFRIVGQYTKEEITSIYLQAYDDYFNEMDKDIYIKALTLKNIDIHKKNIECSKKNIETLVINSSCFNLEIYESNEFSYESNSKENTYSTKTKEKDDKLYCNSRFIKKDEPGYLKIGVPSYIKKIQIESRYNVVVNLNCNELNITSTNGSIYVLGKYNKVFIDCKTGEVCYGAESNFTSIEAINKKDTININKSKYTIDIINKKIRKKTIIMKKDFI